MIQVVVIGFQTLMISYGWCITEERKTVDHEFGTISKIYMRGFPSYHVSADLPHPPSTQRKNAIMVEDVGVTTSESPLHGGERGDDMGW